MADIPATETEILAKADRLAGELQTYGILAHLDRKDLVGFLVRTLAGALKVNPGTNSGHSRSGGTWRIFVNGSPFGTKGETQKHKVGCMGCMGNSLAQVGLN